MDVVAPLVVAEDDEDVFDLFRPAPAKAAAEESSALQTPSTGQAQGHKKGLLLWS